MIQTFYSGIYISNRKEHIEDIKFNSFDPDIILLIVGTNKLSQMSATEEAYLIIFNVQGK
jgi:hypothetical protein